MDPLNPMWGYLGALERSGFKGLLLLSGLPSSETIESCLTRFPSRYLSIREGEKPGYVPLNGNARLPGSLEALDEDAEKLPGYASLLIGRVVEERVKRPSDQLERLLALRLNLPDPDWTTVVRIQTDAGPLFESETRISMPFALEQDALPVGEMVIAVVLVLGETPEGLPSGAVLICNEVELPVTIPDYGLPLAGNYARSCLNQVWATNVDLRPFEEAASQEVRTHLRALHAPDVEADVANTDVMSADVLRAFALRKHLTPILPPPRLVKTVFDAEAYAAEVMQALGFRNSRVTPQGNDGGIDVVSDRGVAQVKMEGLPTGRPALQALVGAATVEGKIPLFFSLAGFTQQAQEWATLAGVAAFEFAFDGEIIPRTEFASTLLRNGLTGEV